MLKRGLRNFKAIIELHTKKKLMMLNDFSHRNQAVMKKVADMVKLLLSLFIANNSNNQLKFGVLRLSLKIIVETPFFM